MKHNRKVIRKRVPFTRKQILYLLYLNSENADWDKVNGGMKYSDDRDDPFEIMPVNMHIHLQNLYNEMRGCDGYLDGKDQLTTKERFAEISMRKRKKR